MESAKFGFWTGYGNCLTIHASTAGLHLKVWPIFSLGHPPLFLPASEIRNAHRRNFFGIARVRFHDSDRGQTPIQAIPLPVGLSNSFQRSLWHRVFRAFEPNRPPIRLVIWLQYEPNICHIRLMSFNWQQVDWPEFRDELDGVAGQLLAFADHAGQVGGLLEGLPDELGTETVLDLMIAEAVRSSAIEGEILNPDAVMSSIRNRLGLNSVPQRVDSRMADGAGELMIAVRDGFREPLSEETPTTTPRKRLRGAMR